jgi:hypothetical protein
MFHRAFVDVRVGAVLKQEFGHAEGVLAAVQSQGVI